MLTIHDEPNCGNAPRHEILRNLVVALAQRQKEVITSLVADDVVWTIIGERSLVGKDAVSEWAATLSKAREVTFGSLITHGRAASVDGVLVLADGVRRQFCHVLRFANAAKTAKVIIVDSYLINLENIASTNVA